MSARLETAHRALSPRSDKEDYDPDRGDSAAAVLASEVCRKTGNGVDQSANCQRKLDIKVVEKTDHLPAASWPTHDRNRDDDGRHEEGRQKRDGGEHRSSLLVQESSKHHEVRPVPLIDRV